MAPTRRPTPDQSSPAVDAGADEPELSAGNNSHGLHSLSTTNSSPAPSNCDRSLRRPSLSLQVRNTLCCTPQAHGRWLVLIRLLSPSADKHAYPCNCYAAIYTVYTSPNHAPIPNHLPTLIVTPHGTCTALCAPYRASHSVITRRPTS